MFTPGFAPNNENEQSMVLEKVTQAINKNEREAKLAVPFDKMLKKKWEDGKLGTGVHSKINKKLAISDANIFSYDNVRPLDDLNDSTKMINKRAREKVFLNFS